MKIGIYVDVARDEKPSGIGLHIRHLLHALAEVDDENLYLLYYRRDLVGRGGDFPHRPDRPNFRNRPVRFPAGWEGERPRLWWEHYLPMVFRKDGLDVFHGPNHLLPTRGDARLVVTIHDLAYFRRDDLYPPRFNRDFRAMTRAALGRADAVIALSENTRRDVESLGMASERVRVIYGGGHVVPDNEVQHGRAEEVRRSLGLPPRFVLFVGSLEARKNVPFLLRAFAEAKRRGDQRGLVLVGHRSSAFAEVGALIDELGLGPDVVVTGYVEDWQLPLIYKMADAFAMPTLYEGFTLVTLEAMAYGVPVVATDVSSIREGVGDAAILVEVGDVEALANALIALREDDQTRLRLVERGRERAARFTWRRCAEETRALYEELGGSGSGSRFEARVPQTVAGGPRHE